MSAPREPGRRRLTRRQAIGAGVAAVGAVGAAGYGRFAVGQEFEAHLAGVLGISLDGARGLITAARRRAGDAEYDVRAAAFLAATTAPGERVLPVAVRERAVGSLLYLSLEESEETFLALGLRTSLSPSCGGLLRR